MKEDLESLRLKESQANTKSISEIKRLRQELEQVKDRYGKQVINSIKSGSSLDDYTIKFNE